MQNNGTQIITMVMICIDHYHQPNRRTVEFAAIEIFETETLHHKEYKAWRKVRKET